jgi:chemotaxis protein MotB
MKNLRVFIGVIAVAIILCSCGTGKKLDAANATIMNLQSENQALKNKVDAQQKQLDEFAASRQVALQEFDKYRKDCEAAKIKLDEVRAMFAEQYAKLQAIKQKIAEALMDFDDKGVDVYYKDGFVYVSMEDNLLYKPGSAALGAEGKKALGNLANALNGYPDLKVIVVGNTDDVMYKKGNMDNWTLSTDRANGVVRILRDDYKVDPTRLTAAGKGKYNPIADNTTKEGKAKNRRTEIILNPDLEKIWDSVQEK